ncbi:MAG: M56 family metallopeptidase [Lachnospiraceae bacterium]
MNQYIVYFIATMIIIDMIVLIASFIPSKYLRKIGYHWRKFLWFFIAIRLVIPMHSIIDLADDIFADYIIEIELPKIFVQEAELVEEALITDTSNYLSENEIGNQVESNAESTIEEEYTEIYQGNLNEEKEIEEEAMDNSTMLLEKPSYNISTFSVLLSIWIVGAWLCMVVRAIQFKIITIKLMETALHPVSKNIILLVELLCVEYRIKRIPEVLIQPDITSPMLIGYIKPVILLPDTNIGDAELELILRHELQHHKCKDVWYKLFIVVISDLYWFNPVLRLMKLRAFQDVEYVCDDRVMKCLAVDEKKQYATMILKGMANDSKRDITFSTCFYVGENASKERIKQMFYHKNKWDIPVLLGLCVLIIIGTCMWTFEETMVPEQENHILQEDNLEGLVQDVILEEATLEEIELPVFYTKDINLISLEDDFQIENYYKINATTAFNLFIIDENQVLWVAGENRYGQLGIGEIGQTIVEPIKIAENVISVDASTNANFTVYLTEDGSLYGMGANMYGLLGETYEEGVTLDYESSVKVTTPKLLMEDVSYVSVGLDCIVVLKKDGSVWRWGEYTSTRSDTSNASQLYSIYASDRSGINKMIFTEPVQILEDCIYVTTGNRSGAAISSDFELYTWGLNLYGQCGIAPSADDFIRTPTKVLEDVSMVWVEEIRNNTLSDTILDFNDRYTYYNNIFVQLQDGRMVAAGEGVGTDARTIIEYIEIGEENTVLYSSEFSKVEVREYIAE